ncbi:TMV resistance protein N-like isoform X2 [Prosopis cineraria]|uniref:TMV resistance protein N-like isoform X2 n=1 Tax=Prosopis cineraria TaxID=364024 RepID=UPI00240EB5DE|nr:TMV resistance protein N-like isoform X2 [Prosopis cineraria]
MQEFGLEDSDKVVTLMNRRPDLVVRHPRNLQRVLNTIYKELDISSRQNSWPSRRSQNFIDSIVQKIDKSDQIAPVGIRYNRVEEVIRLLDLGSKDVVRVIGISGMGGVGKTALAGDVFHKISHSFDYTCFLTDVTDSLLSEVLRAALQEEYVDEYNIDGRLRYHRMLIVFDDVEDVDKLVHLRHLTRIRTWLGGGSRIIIISRDQHVLKMLGVDEIHKVELLNKNEALRLFVKQFSIVVIL